jgi:hypothetical protein
VLLIFRSGRERESGVVHQVPEDICGGPPAMVTSARYRRVISSRPAWDREWCDWALEPQSRCQLNDLRTRALLTPVTGELHRFKSRRALDEL